jgi:hypothetical protein
MNNSINKFDIDIIISKQTNVFYDFIYQCNLHDKYVDATFENNDLFDRNKLNVKTNNDVFKMIETFENNNFTFNEFERKIIIDEITSYEFKNNITKHDMFFDLKNQIRYVANVESLKYYKKLSTLNNNNFKFKINFDFVVRHMILIDIEILIVCAINSIAYRRLLKLMIEKNVDIFVENNYDVSFIDHVYESNINDIKLLTYDNVDLLYDTIDDFHSFDEMIKHVDEYENKINAKIIDFMY